MSSMLKSFLNATGICDLHNKVQLTIKESGLSELLIQKLQIKVPKDKEGDVAFQTGKEIGRIYGTIYTMIEDALACGDSKYLDEKISLSKEMLTNYHENW